jgi:hypothetical protein
MTTARRLVQPGGSNTEVQFNDSSDFGGDSGLTYIKATDFLTVAGGVVTPVIRPATDSVTAVQVQNDDGSDVLVNADTTNVRIGVGSTAPTTKVHIIDEDAVTDAITDVVTIGHNSTGTTAAVIPC